MAHKHEAHDASTSFSIASYHTSISAEIPSIVTMQTLLDQPLAQPEWIIQDVLPSGVSLLAGPARADKPLLANQVGLSVALGLPFLGRFPARRGRVLYLALAESELQVRGRACALLNGQSHPDNFLFAFQWLPFRQGGLADLEDTIAGLSEPRLIIVDPVEFVQPLRTEVGANGWSRARQNSASEAALSFFLPLSQLATRFNLAILLLHHLPDDWPSNRRDPLAGLTPTGLTNASACNLLLTPTSDPWSCCLHLAGSAVPEQRLRLAFNPADGQWFCEER